MKLQAVIRRGIPRRSFFFAVLGIVSAIGVTPAAWSAADVRIGVVGGPGMAAIEKTAELARKQGISVNIVHFNDWVTPNTALASGDINVNYFQHLPFLENAEKARGFHLVPIAYGVENNIGLYSTSLKNVHDVKEGATVAVANDPINEARGLLLFQRAGLIRLKDGGGPNSTVQDIVVNPKHLHFIEEPGPQLARVLSDVAIGLSYPQYLKAAGTVDPTQALIFTHDTTHRYALRFVVRPQDADNAAIKRFIAIYQDSPAVRRVIKKTYGSPSLYQLAWLDENESAQGDRPQTSSANGDDQRSTTRAGA